MSAPGPDAQQAAQAPISRPNAAPVDSGAIGRLSGPQIADEGVGTGAGEGAPRQDTGSAWVTRSTDCPEAPAQAHPLVGRLNEAERAEIGWAVERDWQLRDQRGDWDGLHAVVERIVREHTDRALAEVADRIASSVSPNFALMNDGTEDSRAAAYVEGLHDAHQIVRAARQEQGR